MLAVFHFLLLSVMKEKNLNMFVFFPLSFQKTWICLVHCYGFSICDQNYYRKYQEVKIYAELHIKQKNNEEQAKHCQFFFLLLSHTTGIRIIDQFESCYVEKNQTKLKG